jgi:hypothetical protein
LNQLKLLGHLQDFFSHSNYVYLILDGINHEQSDTEGPTITEFLYKNLHRLPSWLKLIITMNRLDTDQLQAEQNTFLQNFALFEFEDDIRWTAYLHNDIREYLSKRLEVCCHACYLVDRYQRTDCILFFPCLSSSRMRLEWK